MAAENPRQMNFDDYLALTGEKPVLRNTDTKTEPIKVNQPTDNMPLQDEDFEVDEHGRKRHVLSWYQR